MSSTKKSTRAPAPAPAPATALPSWEDMGKLAQQFKLPGIDLGAFMEWQRKDMEALAQAHRQLYEGMATLAKRRAEILHETLTQWQEASKTMASGQNAMAGQAEALRQGIQKAMANFKELAELEVKAGTDAWQVVQERMQENMNNLQQLLQAKK